MLKLAPQDLVYLVERSAQRIVDLAALEGVAVFEVELVVDGLDVEVGEHLVASGVEEEETRVPLREDGQEALLKACDRLLEHLAANVLLILLAIVVLLLELLHRVCLRLVELVLHVVAAVHELGEGDQHVQVPIVLDYLPYELKLGQLCRALRGVNQHDRHEAL